MKGISKDYLITELGRKGGYCVDFFQQTADEIRKHHYNDDYDFPEFELYVTSYAVGKDGKKWNPLSYDMATVVGISVLSNNIRTIDWFVKGWIERGILQEVENTENTK